MLRLYRRNEALVIGTLSLVTIGLIWQLAVDAGLIKAFFVSEPTAVARNALDQFDTGELTANLTATLISFAMALGLATAAGVGLGMVAGWFSDVEAALEPFIWFKYSAPTIAFYPLFVAWLGYGRPTVVAIGALFALTPIYANTLSGIKNVDQDLVRAATSFGARPYDVFFRVALPGSIPIVVAGLRLGVGRALTGVVLAELFGANAGLGYSIAYHAQLLETTPMMVSIVAIILLGVMLTQLLSWLERKTDSWRVT
jgi:NitT/TauT family transport system permease protein